MMSSVNGVRKYHINEKTGIAEEFLIFYPESYLNNKNHPEYYTPLNPEEIICEFIIKEKLGEGGFGSVRLGINKQTGEKVGREVQKVVRSENIPIDVIRLINDYDKDFLKIYDTYNIIYNSRNKNPLYRNLRNKDLEIPELAIALSSLVTKILISCSKISDEKERQLFATAMGIEELNDAIDDYILNDDAIALVQCGKQVRELLQLLYTN